MAKEPTQEEVAALAKIRSVGPSSYALMQAAQHAKKQQIVAEVNTPDVVEEPEAEKLEEEKPTEVANEPVASSEPELFPDDAKEE